MVILKYQLTQRTPLFRKVLAIIFEINFLGNLTYLDT